MVNLFNSLKHCNIRKSKLVVMTQSQLDELIGRNIVLFGDKSNESYCVVPNSNNIDLTDADFDTVCDVYNSLDEDDVIKIVK